MEKSLPIDKPKPKLGFRKGTGTAYLFILPFFLLFLTFLLIPSVLSLLIGFLKYDIFAGTLEFVGIKNYIKMFKDELFIKALVNTAYYSVLVIPLTVFFSLLLAILINRKIPGITVLRGIYFLPAIIAWVASGFAWRWMLGVEGGWINFYLSKLGITPHPWLYDAKTALTTVVIVAIWMGLAGKMIIFLAGLKSVPEDYYDAAKIDGVNPIQNFFYITLPLIRNATFFVVVITIVEEIKVFAKAYILARGGQTTHFNVLGGEPSYSTLTLVGYVYGVGFRYLEFGYGSAMSLFILIAILIFTIFQFRFYAKRSF